MNNNLSHLDRFYYLLLLFLLSLSVELSSQFLGGYIQFEEYEISLFSDDMKCY